MSNLCYVCETNINESGGFCPFGETNPNKHVFCSNKCKSDFDLLTVVAERINQRAKIDTNVKLTLENVNGKYELPVCIRAINRMTYNMFQVSLLPAGAVRLTNSVQPGDITVYYNLDEANEQIKKLQESRYDYDWTFELWSVHALPVKKGRKK